MPHTRPRTLLVEPLRRAVAVARRGSRQLQAWLLRRPSRSIWACGVLGFSLAALLTAARGFPPPHVHDEYAYLLAADTFASGRLSYPTHPMWRHFETFHVLQKPAYVSKYPPAQGLSLALGQRLTGSPVVGVWLACGLFVAALNWMLLAWTRPRWALWGAVAAALWLCGRHAWAGYWTSSYWGGSVAAFGGALVLGAVRRLAAAPTVSASIALGTGLAILANSRPFEGAFFAIVPMALVGWMVIRHLWSGRWKAAMVMVGPLGLVLAATAALMAIYNYRITGSATLPPYLVYERQYDASPVMLGQATPARPLYRVAVMERFFTEGTGLMQQPKNWREHVQSLREHSERVTRFYAPWFVIPLLFVLPWAASGAWIALAIGSVTAVVGAMSLTLFILQPHYAAPAAAAWCALLTLGARYTAQLHRRRAASGRGIVRLVMLCLIVSVMAQVGAGFIRRLDTRSAWAWQRRAIERSLSRTGRHLVLVKYGPDHIPDREWVFNRGDIDGAAVVWARSLGALPDAELRRYFADRTIWTLRIDDDEGPFPLTPLATYTTPRASRRP